MQNDVISFLLKRRSVVAKKMLPEEPTPADLESMFACDLRVPDHSNVQPWRIVVLQGPARKQVDEQVILTTALINSKLDNQEGPKAKLTEAQQVLEANRMQHSGVVIAVLSKPVLPHKISLWEQQLSAGAVCTQRNG